MSEKKSAKELEKDLYARYRQSLIDGYKEATDDEQDGIFMYLMSHGITPAEIGIELPAKNLMPDGQLNLLSLVKKKGKEKMDGQVLNDVVEKALKNASRKVRITFKEEAIGEINYLLGMERGGIISLQVGDKMVMMAVAQSGIWEFDENKTLEVTLAEDFDKSWFVGRMRRALEKIEAI